MKDQTLFTRSQVAKVLQVSERTLYRWQDLGLPFLRIGGLVRYDLPQVRKWIDDNNEVTRIEIGIGVPSK